MQILDVKYPVPGAMTERPLSIMTDVIVHHTDGPVTQTPLEIDAEHRAIGDAMIAYNFLVDTTGKVYRGRPLQFVPAANFGRNTESLAIVCIGQFHPSAPDYHAPSQAQLTALEALLVYVHRTYPQLSRTYGHRDVWQKWHASEPADNFATACPGDTLYEALPAIIGRVHQALVNKK